MQYRITLSPLLVWATIHGIQRFRFLQTKQIAGYLFFCIVFVQYVLHLPLSYLSKEWFWEKPQSVATIQAITTKYLTNNVPLVAQNNIIPHVSHRDEIYVLYPEEKRFPKNSPCGETVCDWFRWFGSPKFLFVDTASNWDARHLLTDRKKFIAGLDNLEKKGVISIYIQSGTTVLYQVHTNPENVR